jgi:two-component system OmpR family sensor kinase
VTLQRRVLGYLALAAVASCTLTVAVGVILVRHQVVGQRLSALESQAELLAAVGGAPSALLPGAHVYRVGGGTPRLLRQPRAAAVLAAIPGGGNAQGNVTVDGHSIIYAARVSANGRIVLIRSAGVAFAEWRPFLGSLIVAGLGGALLALILSYLLARRLTRPIATLSSATRRIAQGESEVAVPVDGHDELADLGRAFNEMSGELSSSRESQRRFLESVSHELKTPLTSIRGYAEALEEGAVSPTDGGRVIRAEAVRLERLVQDLLDLARVGRDGFSVDRVPVWLPDLIAQAIERHRPRAEELSVSLAGEVGDGAWALGDPGRLLQVISNLIENALRVTPVGGHVLVCGSPGQISVRDTGPGLKPEDIPRAFERFYLYDRYRSERPVGSGLGLTIVEQLVRAMGGTVEASSLPSGGAMFNVRLPVTDAAATRAATPARSAQPDAARPSA